MGDKLEQTLAVLNGLVGDYLARTGNGLATEMACYVGGQPVALEPAALARAFPNATQRVVVLVHGVMCTESVWTLPDGTDYGTALSRDLGYTPVFVRYNSGRAIADNGAALAALLERLVAAFPVKIAELLPIGYSMGGLVVRGACHVAALAGQAWLAAVRRTIYVGTPHFGAPAERAGRLFARLMYAIDDPYTKLIADIGNLRSAGIQDLGDAVLRHEDRAASVKAALRDARHPVPLLPQIAHYLIAGSLSPDPRLSLLFGDAVVPVTSATHGALGEVANELLPPRRVKVFPGLSHLMLPRHADVYAQIKAFCEEELS